jgi:hypothetical protein
VADALPRHRWSEEVRTFRVESTRARAVLVEVIRDLAPVPISDRELERLAELLRLGMAPGMATKVSRFTVRKRPRQPKLKTGCLKPGAKRLSTCAQTPAAGRRCCADRAHRVDLARPPPASCH